MIILLRSDFWISVLSVLFGCFVYYEAASLGAEAAFFPRIVSYIFIISGILNFAYLIKSGIKGSSISFRKEYFTVSLFVIGCFVYMGVVGYLGYIVSSLAFMMYIFYLLGCISIRYVVSGSLFVGLVWFVFEVLLSSFLPGFALF